MPSIALIVEGEYDVEALSPLTGRLNPQGVQVRPLICGGPVRGKFQRRLRILRHLGPISRAVVVTDADGRDPNNLRAAMEQEIRDQGFPFPVEPVVLVQELEALLLADPRAIESVCEDGGRFIELPNLTRSPELYADPKTELVRILRRAGLAYTKAVAGRIAMRSNLDSLEYWCESFRRFRMAVTLP